MALVLVAPKPNPLVTDDGQPSDKIIIIILPSIQHFSEINFVIHLQQKFESNRNDIFF